MSTSGLYDIIPMLRNLTAMLDPIAESQSIRLRFTSRLEKLQVEQNTIALITGIIELIYKIINYTAENNEISITVDEKKADGESFLLILIVNTGTNLSRVTELTNHLKPTMRENHTDKGGTLFEISYPIERNQSSVKTGAKPETVMIPAFYAEIRKRFASHFSKAEHLVASLSNYNPREATFLKKVNALILENIDNPQMDANYISNAMHMSRTQLFRRLKPIIRQSPGSYIKTLKLQKAKELFETTDLRINEVAYKTGFESPSHFTKAFIKHFGVKPSLFCRNKMQQMNKQTQQFN